MFRREFRARGGDLTRAATFVRNFGRVGLVAARHDVRRVTGRVSFAFRMARRAFAKEASVLQAGTSRYPFTPRFSNTAKTYV